MEVELSESTLRGVDRANRSMAIDVVGWDDSVDPATLPVELDAKVGGRVTSLQFGDVLTQYRRLDGDDDGYDSLLTEEGTHYLSDGEHLLRFTHGVLGYVHFHGSATLRRGADDAVAVEFTQPTPVTIGFWSLVDFPEETVTVAPTPSGLATGITHLSASLSTMAPERSMPGWREHPPRIEVGEETAAPESVVDSTPETGIELVVPDSFEAVYAATTLSYYLGADLTVADRESPILQVPETGFEREFSPLPEFQFEAARTFQRTFYLDCLVAPEGSTGSPELAERDLLDGLALDPAACYDAAPAERLERYLESGVESVEHLLPERNYVTYVDPVPGNAPALPFVLRYLGLVYLADALEAGRRPDGETVPGRADARRRMTGVIGAVAPDSGVFEAVPEAYEHRLEHLTEGDSDVSIVVVGGGEDDQPGTYAQRLVETYRDNDEHVDGTVSWRPTPSRAELASLLESRTDLVHLLAPGRDGGIDCSDGVLAPEELSRSRTRIFVLDGPETRPFGRALVREGSVAGLVRPGNGVKRHPEYVVPLVRLLLQGYSVALAANLVGQTVDAADPFWVLGDGTHNVLEEDAVNLLPLYVEANGDGSFDVSGDVSGPTTGAVFHPGPADVRPRLLSNGIGFTVDGIDIREVIGDPGFLVVYENELHWSKDIEAFYPIA